MESSGGQLLLSEEQWSKRENDEGKLLLTREEWLKRTTEGGTCMSFGQRPRSKFDKSKVRCFNCESYGHYVVECKKSRSGREQKEEVNIVQMQDDKPAFLLEENADEGDKIMLINEGKMLPKLNQSGEIEQVNSNLWYLDNGTCNHMTG